MACVRFGVGGVRRFRCSAVQPPVSLYHYAIDSFRGMRAFNMARCQVRESWGARIPEGDVSTIVFHIGVHKTGTTSLQAFLRANATLLSTVGIYTPKAGCIDAASYANVHNVAWQLLGINLFNPAFGSWESLLAELRRVRPRMAILSAEDLEFLDDAQVQALSQAIPDFDKVVVVYLRRHDELLTSEYTHQLREGITTQTFDQWYEFSKTDPRFDFVTLLSRWRAAGFEVRVRSFHAQCREQADLCRDFLQAIGAPNELVLKSTPVEPQNQKLPGNVAILLRESMSIIDRTFDVGGNRSELAATVWWHLLQFLPRGPSFNPMSDRIRAELAAKYVQDFSRVEADYANGKQLFPRETASEPTFAALGDLTADEIVTGLSSVAGALWLELKRLASRRDT